MQSKLIVLLCLILVTGCQRNRAEDNARINVPGVNEGAGNNPQSVPVLKNALTTTPVSACDYIAKLKTWGDYDQSASFLKVLNMKDGKPEGGLDVSEAPFVQIYFGEKFVVATPEEFLEMVEVEHKKGNISAIEYTAIQAAKISPALLRRLQMTATNKKLAENFQGVFGEQGSLEKSVHWLLLGKTIPYDRFIYGSHAPILTARLPLYSFQWGYLASDVRQSMTGAVSSLSAEPGLQGDTERVCGLALWQRAFAQLLSLKGYVQPEMLKSDASNPLSHHVEKLSGDNQAFKKYSRTGALFDPRLQRSVVASADELSNYDPTNRVLQVSEHLPWASQTQTKAGTFTDTLHLMESLVYFYAASSPSAPWFSTQPYIFVTDILDPNNKGVVPSDAHNLALGLLKLNLKNLAKFHIIQVNKDGQELKTGESAAGFVPVESRTQGVSLQNVIQLTRISVYLDQALSQFKNGTPEKWQAMNPLYSEKILAQLVGTDLFSKDKLNELLSAQEQAEILKNTLVKMRLPLASLLGRMALTGACSSHWSWDLKTGATKPTAVCDPQLRTEAQLALRTLAMHIGSPLFYEMANSQQ
jgi:hypothetical protein